MSRYKGVRSYGPGKFNTILDSIIYQISLDGCNESLGDVQDFGHYDAIELDFDYVKKTAEEDGETLTLEEEDLVRQSYGAILFENNQGFVDVTYYDTKDEFEKAWAELEEEYDKFREGSEEDY